MKSIKPILAIGCILLTLFATHSEGSGGCVDPNNKEICATHYLQDCGKEPAPPNNSHLPQYLVIGDSIARGMFPSLKKELEDTIEAHIVPGTPETAADGVNCIKVWVGPNLDRWDVISFNFGLQDSTESTEADYASNVKEIITYLMQTKAGKNKKLISIFTVPTANTSCCPNTPYHSVQTGPNKFPCPYTIESYNSLLHEIFQYFPSGSITVDDLFAYVNLYCCHHSHCYFDVCDLYQSTPKSTCLTSFTPDGWDYLATHVSTTVKKVLKQEY